MTGWIVPPIDRREAAPIDRYGPHNRPERVQPIEALIYHYTGPGSGAVEWLTRDDEHYVSAHFVVSRDGRVRQLVSLDERAIHAGGATSKLFGKGGTNNRTIGIEIENMGPAWQRKEKYVDQLGRRITDESVLVCTPHPISNWWEAYPPGQVDALVALVRRLVSIFPVLRDQGRHLGHADVDPLRKVDPGPAFPWARIREALT